MIKFEKVSKYADVDLIMPERKTTDSGGYDLAVAEDIIIPSFGKHWSTLLDQYDSFDPMTLDQIAAATKATGAKPTLVSTGMKCYMEIGQYLKLVPRSSCPLKHWLVLANSEGIIDRDYVDNPDNEGEIFLQFINLSPFDIQLHRGDMIGQGIICNYIITDDDAATGKRIGGFGSTSEAANG